MRSYKSIILFLIMVGLVTTANAQNVEFDFNQTIDEDQSELGVSIMLLDQTQTFTLNPTSDDATTKKQRKNGVNNLDLPLPKHRYNLNFVLVDPCRFAGNPNVNLSLLRNGYDPYYPNANYFPTFTESLVCSLTKSILRQLR